MEMHTRASLQAIHGIDGVAPVRFGVGDWLRGLLKRMHDADRRRRDYEILMAKSEHELSDIGLTRADVVPGLRAAAWLRTPTPTGAETMLTAFVENPAASAAGFLALVCLTIWPLFRTREGILWAQLGAGIGFASHYALLGIAAPSLVNVLGIAQTGAALYSTRNVALNRLGYGLIPLMIATGIYFWTGPASALCVVAMGLIALGRMQANPRTLRILILSGGVFWSVHDYLVESWIALAADISSLAIGILMMTGVAFAKWPIIRLRPARPGPHSRRRRQQAQCPEQKEGGAKPPSRFPADRCPPMARPGPANRSRLRVFLVSARLFVVGLRPLLLKIGQSRRLLGGLDPVALLALHSVIRFSRHSCPFQCFRARHPQ